MNDLLVKYPGPCPECGHGQHVILNASMPTINRCCRCDHTWNPDNAEIERTRKEVEKRKRRNKNRRLRDDALRSLNLVPVKGIVSGETYWE